VHWDDVLFITGDVSEILVLRDSVLLLFKRVLNYDNVNVKT